MTANQSAAAFITGLFETHLQVANLELSMEFYERILGLELAMKEQARRVAFYWVGGYGKTVLGLWEKPPWVSGRSPGAQIITQHFAFEIDLADLGRTVAAVKQRGIELRNFFEQITDIPSVFGWLPAASMYFNDPDGHLLEFLAKLPGKKRPEIGIVSLDEWNRLNQSPNSTPTTSR
ncbi:MAG TPA: VOC family protein [Candidatus Acidoferrum sp.]|nr:VOC family protein [Candidatus Acidoferrum sp.]